MRKKTLVFIGMALFFALVASTGWAQVSPEEAARLGKDCMPLGGELAGNAEGTIPAWEGGITAPVDGYLDGGHYPDPFADEKPLLTITAANMDQYAEQLTAGQKALLKAYDSYRINVYPTHRTAAAPQHIYDATREIATKAKLLEGGNGVQGAAVGIPFPLPQSGLEVIWNHLLRYRGDASSVVLMAAAVGRDGSFTKSLIDTQFDGQYSKKGMTEEKMDNILFHYKNTILSPPRSAGRILLVHETMDQNKEPRKAWLYNPGQRRVRRAPDVSFDNPKDGADGLATNDMTDMFNGSPERYEWKLVGKKEMYVPYNTYQLLDPAHKYKDVVMPRHPNPDHIRYELHRVWVVEATLKEGVRHLMKRRTFYVDEDSWQIVTADMYDGRDQLWRVMDAYGINYYDMPGFAARAWCSIDLEAGRYYINGLTNEEKSAQVNITEWPKREFTTTALRQSGRR